MSAGLVEIRDGKARALLSAQGAELLSWQIGDAELMWTPDPAFWDRVSPLLFPVVGWCKDGAIRVGGQSYLMGVHGFAAQSDFEIAGSSAAQVKFVLRDNESTRVHFPYAFEFSVTYRLIQDSLQISLNVRNKSAGSMPYACGLHPGFRWPFAGAARDQYSIEFAEAEQPEVPVIAPGGLFSQAMRPIAIEGRRLALSEETFAMEALCFLNARSRSLAFIAPSGSSIRANFTGFPHLALWSRPGAPFLCLEAWTGYGDPVGFSGELGEKPSMRHLTEDQEGFHEAIFRFCAA